MAKSVQKRNFVMTSMTVTLMALAIFSFNPIHDAYSITDYHGTYVLIDPVRVECFEENVGSFQWRVDEFEISHNPAGGEDMFVSLYDDKNNRFHLQEFIRSTNLIDNLVEGDLVYLEDANSSGQYVLSTQLTDFGMTNSFGVTFVDPDFGITCYTVDSSLYAVLQTTDQPGPNVDEPLLEISPTTSSVTPMGQISFSATGGDGNYQFTLLENNSNGTIDPATGAYTAGSTGSVTDIVKVTDSLGAMASATISVTAGEESKRDEAGRDEVKKIPGWIKNTFLWYGQDQISEDELISALQFLIKKGIIKIGEPVIEESKPIDTDGDGIMDDDDSCILEPETFNRFEDSDGCPDNAPEPNPTLAGYWDLPNPIQTSCSVLGVPGTVTFNGMQISETVPDFYEIRWDATYDGNPSNVPNMPNTPYDASVQYPQLNLSGFSSTIALAYGGHFTESMTFDGDLSVSRLFFDNSLGFQVVCDPFPSTPFVATYTP